MSVRKMCFVCRRDFDSYTVGDDICSHACELANIAELNSHRKPRGIGGSYVPPNLALPPPKPIQPSVHLNYLDLSSCAP